MTATEGHLRWLVVAVMALTAAIACRSTTEPGRTEEFKLRLTTDSESAPTSGCASYYCYKLVPTSHTVMTERLSFGPRTSDLSPPTCCLGTILFAFSDVVFADSLRGKAVIDADSIVSVVVGPPTFRGYYDSFLFTGRITNGRFAGRWVQEINPHGVVNVGSFVTLP